MSEKPKTVRMTEDGWKMVMDLGLLKDGVDLEEVSKTSGEPVDVLKFMQILAKLTLEAEESL